MRRPVDETPKTDVLPLSGERTTETGNDCSLTEARGGPQTNGDGHRAGGTQAAGMPRDLWISASSSGSWSLR